MGTGNHQDERLRFGVFEADLLARELYKRGTLIRVQDKPFQMLAALLERPGEVVTREELRTRLWTDGTFVDFEKGLNTAAKKLRTTLGDSSDSPIFIETIPRKGYRFIAPVIKDNGVNGQRNVQPANPDESSKAPSPAFDGVQTRGQPRPTSRFAARKYAIVTICFPLIIVLGIFLLKFRSRIAVPSNTGLEVAQLTNSGNIIATGISPDGRYVAYSQANRQGYSLRLLQVATTSDAEILSPEQGQILGITFSVDNQYIYFVRADPKGLFGYLYRVPLIGGEPQKIISDIDSPVSFSPDGRRLAYERFVPLRNDVELKVANADGTEQKILAVIHNGNFGQFGPGLSWSPDGRVLAVSVFLVGSQRRWIIATASLDDGSLSEVFHSSNNVSRPVWTPRGEMLLVAISDPLSHRSQLWNISIPLGEARQLTRDLSDYSGLDITHDGTAIAAITQLAHSDVWLVSSTDASKGEQITSGSPSMFDAVQLPNRRILAVSENGLWTMTPEGKNRSLFNVNLNNGFVPNPCGRFVVFLSSQAGRKALMRADSDGGNLITLIAGNPVFPVCSANGKYIYYVNFDQPQYVWRIPVAGGTPAKVGKTLGDSLMGRLSISPDGQLLAYPYTEFTDKPEPNSHLAVISAIDASTKKTFQVPADINAPKWSHDGRSLQYLLTRDGATNIWEQSLAGGEPRQITQFRSGHIFDFSWATDGRHFLLTRGDISSDVVLVRGFQ